MRTDFSAKVAFCNKELTAKEKIAIKDYNGATRFDSVVTDDIPFIVQIDKFAIIDVHNERSKNPDYTTLVVVDTAGTKYCSSSESLINAIKDIYEELKAEGIDEDFTIEVYRKPSKNYQGKSFLSCSLAM